MKKILITIALMLASTAAWCQQSSYTVEGSTYKSVKSATTKSSVKDTVTPYTFEVSGTKYPIVMGKTGSCYIVRTSKKSGKEYRQYLGEEVSRDICRKMQREYKGKKSSK